METEARTVRGSHVVTSSVPWRMDGNTADPEAPLVVCLHGMGMDENFFALLLQRLFALPFHFLVPRAPFPVEVRREGRIGASWYAYDGDQERFRSELARTEELVLGLVTGVERDQNLRPRVRVLFGFSQGGYCGSYLAVRNPDRFGGMAVSGARVKTEFLSEEMPRAAAHGFRALLCHGARDASVLPESAERSRASLAKSGIEVELRTFDSGHSLGRQQVIAISDWLTTHFG